jgi:ketosteroid isomerase-like protein
MTDDEREVRAIEQRIRDAIGRRDIDGIVREYASDGSLVIFDDIVPLKLVGGQSWRRAWEDAFAMLTGAWRVEAAEMEVACGGDVAFTWSILKMSAATADGSQKVEGNFRLTQGYRKIGGRWLCTHSHLSLPLDPATWTAVFDAT